MTDFEQAMEAVVAATGVERYRHLCSDANALPPPNSRDDWRRWVLERAGALAGMPPRPTVAQSLDLTSRMNVCPHRTTDPGCGCSGGRCAERGGAIVSHIDGFACLGDRR